MGINPVNNSAINSGFPAISMRTLSTERHENGYKITITHSWLVQLEITEAWVTEYQSMSIELPTLTDYIQQLKALEQKQITLITIQSN